MDSAEARSVAEGLVELERLQAAGARPETKVVRVFGCEGAVQALAIARLAAKLPPSERPLVAVTPDEARASSLARDLRFFMHAHHSPDDPIGSPRVLHLPHYETTPWADISPDRRALVQRMATLFRLSQGLAGDVLVASAPALARRVIPRDAYAELVDVVEAE